MRVIVCGSRGWGNVPGDALAVHDRIAALPDDAVVVHGGARGADTLAGGNARQRGLDVEKYPARWTDHGSRAGHIRNDLMLDKVIAFWNGTSPGTRSMIEKARKRGIPVEVAPASERAAAVTKDHAELLREVERLEAAVAGADAHVEAAEAEVTTLSQEIERLRKALAEIVVLAAYKTGGAAKANSLARQALADTDKGERE